jgi:methylamine utilization protein MauE
MRFDSVRALVTSTRLTLAIVFMGAAGAKLLMNQPAHSHSSRGFEGLLRSDWFGISVALVELSVACLLFSRRWRVGLDLSVLLAISFLGVLLSMEIQGIPLSSCGCFGSISVEATTHALLAYGIGCAALLGRRAGTEMSSNGRTASSPR